LVVTLGSAVRFPLFLRVPVWASGVRLSVNGQQVSGEIKGGSYYPVDREWKKGDVVEMELPMPLRIEEQPEYAVMPQGKDDLYRVNWFAFARGPLVYASDGLLEGRDREMNFKLGAGEIGKYAKVEGADTGVSADGKGAVTVRFAPPVEKPVVFRPFYEAGGREAGTWRLTWMQYGID
jgi:hypothetical protein